MAKIRLASPIQYDSIVDGEGLRIVLWLQGCPHRCFGCHNLETHDYKGGQLYEINDIVEEINGCGYFDGITFSGGEPLLQVEAVLEIAKKIKCNKWLYSGYLFEDIIKMSQINRNLEVLLKELDVIVDGRFDLDLKSLNLNFRGSKNQRIINVKQSLKKNKVVIKK